MLELPPIFLAVAFGFLHALVPCAHSWPMLLPFVGRGRGVAKPALLFGAGVMLASAMAGALIGTVVDTVPPTLQHRAEEITGIILVVLGVVIAVRPRHGHLGHMHGACAPDEGPKCGHSRHEPRRFAKLGAGLSLFLLGFINLTIPCWTNLSVVSLSLSSHGVWEGLVLFLAYGGATTVTMVFILWLAERGYHLLERLRGGVSEARLVRASGVFLVLCGLSLVFHWHSHSHPH